jgi:prophage regulatory protein
MSDSDSSGGKKTRRRRTPRTQPLTAVDIPGAQLTLETVIALTGFGKTSIYKKMREGDFPPPLKIGQRSTRWRSDDIRLWLDHNRRGPEGPAEAL